MAEQPTYGDFPPKTRPDGVSRRRFLELSGAGAGAAILAGALPAVAGAQPAALTGFVGANIDAPPFSFTYDGVPSARLLNQWPRTSSVQNLGGGRRETTVVWTDPAALLRVRWVTTEYQGFTTASWIVYFDNIGSGPTRTLADVLAIDMTMERLPISDWTIHTARGNYVQTTDFAPLDLSLPPGAFKMFYPLMGMSTQGLANSDLTASNIGAGWPYFNVDWGSSGLIVALGWPGQWAMEIKRGDSQTLQFMGGMSHQDVLGPGDEIEKAELTDLWLEPGESIRTALMVVQPWHRTEWQDAQNVWRQWFIQYHMPRTNGNLPTPICPTQANDYFGGQIDTAQDELSWLDAYGAHNATTGTGGVHDHWWIDSGWYEIPDPSLGWEDVGTWTPDPQRFPNGVKPVFDRAHQLGMGAILWFEPERVMPGTWLAENHPEWLLSAPPGYTSFWGPDGAYHFNFGEPAALRWAIDTFDGLITSQGVDLYREDCNYPFLAYWTHNDPPGRRGITQARYVQGHLAYWETLRQRHPGMLIDNSAGSGHRLDVQLMQYSVSNIQDDEVFDSTGNQCHTYGVRYWLPWTGMAVRVTGSPDDVYNARSAMGLSFHEALDITSATDADWALLRQLASEWRDVAGEYYGDYYPLTPYSTDSNVWMAWQFDRAANGTGVVQAYRRPGSTVPQLQVPLHGLNSGRPYMLTDYGSGRTWTASGQQLMSTGLTIVLPDPSSATNIRYRSM